MKRRDWLFVLGLVALGTLLRLSAIDYGLPHVYNADEPHHVNVAVSFGRGTLDPGVFKYPTLWMYVLFGSYGAFFLIWSGLGFLHSIAQFGELFARDPGIFYLIARTLAAASSLLGAVWVARSGARLGQRRLGLWAGALLAVSPTLIVSSHAAKPESLMFLLAAAATGFALRYLEDGKERSLGLCACAAGLAVSTQYNAAPLALLVPAAWWSHRKGGVRRLLRCGSLLPVAFLLGSPYVLLNWEAFHRDVLDHLMLNALGEPAGAIVVLNAARFGGQAAIGPVLLTVGALYLLSQDRSRAGVLLVPVAGFLLFIGAAPEGTWERYLIGSYPALALIAAFGVEACFARLKRIPLGDAAVQCVVVVGLILPGALESAAFCRRLNLPDTRALSTRWVEEHIPPGSAILTDQDHAGPRLIRSRAQVLELIERTHASGHPRERYYRLLANGHPGGGYRLEQIQRQYADLHSGGWHVQWSASGRSMLDVREGLAAVRRAGIGWVILSSFGAQSDRSPELAGFLREMETKGELVAEFRSVAGVTSGPHIRIYRIL